MREWLQAALHDLKERFLNFKTIDAIWQAPAGCVVVYYAVRHPEYVIAIYFGIRGVQMIYQGVYDFFSNPIKREAKTVMMVEERLKRYADLAD